MPQGRQWWESRIAIAVGFAEDDLDRTVRELEQLREAARGVAPEAETPAIREAQMILDSASVAARDGNPHETKRLLRDGKLKALFEI